MRLMIDRVGNALFVQGEWTDVHGTHTKALADDIPAPVRAALKVVLDWANDDYEPSVRLDLDKYESRRAIDMEIGLLNARRKLLG